MTDSPTPRITALVMAGKRSGALDPLAANAGVSQKAMAPVAGRPMIERVIEAVAACERVGAIRVVAHETDEIAALPLVTALIAQGRLTFRPGAFNIVDSVFAGAEGADFPVLVTTADNCLVTPEGYAEFADKAMAEGAEAAAAFARREDVQAADFEGQKRFYEFDDGGYSNCNMFWIASPGALKAAEIFRGGGQFVKFPARIAKAFGVINLIRFRFGIGSRRKLFESVSRRFGFKVTIIVMSRGEYAIDVDNQRTLEVTERLLAKRAEG